MGSTGITNSAPAAVAGTAHGFNLGSHLSALVGPAVAVLAGIVFALILVRIFKVWKQRNTLSIKGIPPELDLLRGPVLALLPAVFVSIVIRFISLPPGPTGIVRHILSLWIIGALAWLVVKMLAITRRLIMSHFEVGVKDNLRARQVQTQLQVLERIAIFVWW